MKKMFTLFVALMMAAVTMNAAVADGNKVELEFTSSIVDVYGTSVVILLSGPDVRLNYETVIVNKSIAGIHNTATNLGNIGLDINRENKVILDGTAEFTFVSVNESGVYTYMVSFNLVGESGNEYHGEVEIQVEADLSNDITPTALENNAAAIKAVKTIENGQMIIIRDGKKFNAVGAKL